MGHSFRSQVHGYNFAIWANIQGQEDKVPLDVELLNIYIWIYVKIYICFVCVFMFIDTLYIVGCISDSVNSIPGPVCSLSHSLGPKGPQESDFGWIEEDFASLIISWGSSVVKSCLVGTVSFDYRTCPSEVQVVNIWQGIELVSKWKIFSTLLKCSNIY